LVAREEKFKEDRLSQLHYDNSAGEAGLSSCGHFQQTAARLFVTRLAKLEEAAKADSKTSATPPSDANS